MKNTFNGWKNVSGLNLDATMNLILTGHNALQAYPDEWLFKHLGNKTDNIRVLDFGCGIGRNTFSMATINPNWSVVGYDNDVMLSKREDYFRLKFKGPLPSNVAFSSDWDFIKFQKFDTVFCCLVLQHIHEKDLVEYARDFKCMCKKLVVTGRRINDDPKKRSTWTVLEEQGLLPHQFFDGDHTVNYDAFGDNNSHNTAVYLF